MISITRFLAIRPSENRLVGLVLGIMLVSAAGSALGSAGIETLFFTRFGVRFLPFMYMLLGVLTMAVSLFVTARFAHIPAQRLYTALPLVLACVLLLGRLALLLNLPWVYPLLWLGKEIVNTLTGMLVWGTASAACESRQARRLFPLFSAGRILGMVLGGISTGWFVSVMGTENLLIPWMGSMLLAFLFSSLLLGRQGSLGAGIRGSGSRAGFLLQLRKGFETVRASQLMRWIAIASLLFSILYFSLALPFSRTATLRFPDEAQLAGFLGTFQGLSTAAAFLASLLLANRLFARFGIMSMILVLPCIYFVGFGLMALAPVFVVIAGFRFVQTLWLSGVTDPAYQAMFNVIPPERRDQARYFIGGLPEQAGTFLAGLVLLVGEQAFSPSQLALLGLLTSAGCIYVIWRSRGAYNLALLEALRFGRPHVFFSEEEPFGGFRRDADAMAAVLAGMHNPDLVVRRVSAEILERIPGPEAVPVLLEALSDPDAHVRLYALKGLSRNPQLYPLAGVAPLLSDPDPNIRLEAIPALTNAVGAAQDAQLMLEPLLADPAPRVRVQAAAATLKMGRHAQARQLLDEMVLADDEESRVEALSVLPGDFELAASQLAHPHASVRRAAVSAISRLDGARALPTLLQLLGDADLCEHAARELGALGTLALAPVLECLKDPVRESGALAALEHLPAAQPTALEAFARSCVARALRYETMRRSIEPGSARRGLLVELLHEKAHAHALRAVRAVGLLTDREAAWTAIESLQSADRGQRANALETLESLGKRANNILRPLFVLWDEAAVPVQPAQPEPPFSELLADPDPWLRACAAFAAPDPRLREQACHDPDPLVRQAAEAVESIGEIPMDSLPTLSLMERLLFFRRVPLFSGLTTLDLKNVAAIAEEMTFEDGTPIALQNEPGHIMHLVIAGEILVIAAPPGGAPREIARRGPGEIVGEMALISDQPRIADLIAAGRVRTLCIDRHNFHALLRERPEVSLAVMRVLSARIKEMAHAV